MPRLAKLAINVVIILVLLSLVYTCAMELTQFTSDFNQLD